MAKRLGISQRVVRVAAGGEWRDCLDQRWAHLAAVLECHLHPLPTLFRDQVRAYLDATPLDALLLSGGNTLHVLEPQAPHVSAKRDAFECALLEEAIARAWPVLGVCRGLQLINHYFGGAFSSLEGHIGCRHALVVYPPYRAWVAGTVNSYHHWGIAREQLASDLEVIATDTQGHVEACRHARYPIFGMMWHPEREFPFQEKDLTFLQQIL